MTVEVSNSNGINGNGDSNTEGSAGFQAWTALQWVEPKAVDNGIKLTKPIEELARSWWVERWLSIIEQFGLGARLERAKTYAERGQVLSVKIDNGVVRSVVQGTDDEPYRVIIAVKTLPKAIWTSIMSDFASDSRFGISMGSRAMPPQEQIDRVFGNNGALLFPDRQGEMQTKCTCLDWSNPCKHIAAVYLLLAVEFEREPFSIFKLRGLSQQDMFAMLGTPGKHVNAATQSLCRIQSPAEHLVGTSTTANASFTGVEADSPPSEQVDCTTANESNLKLQGFDARTFWKQSVTLELLQSPWQPTAEVAPLAQSLGEFPFWQGDRDLLTCIRSAYKDTPPIAMNLLAPKA